MKLSPIFSDGAIFPAQKNLCVFGEGVGAVTVRLAGNTLYTTAKGGSFRVILPPMPYGGPYELTVSDAEGTVTLSDIYIGEVYILAGQSNIQFKLNESDFTQEDAFCDPLLRIFSTDRIEDSDAHHACDGWVGVTKENMGEFSAIGVLTGEELRNRKNVPIGLITCYQGASVIESWLPEEVAELPCFTIPDSEKFKDHFHEIYGQWNHNGDLYRFGFSQIAPYPVSGVVWYQGESDTSDGEARIYKDELLAMIGVWRSDLLDPTLPFYIIQIADYDYRKDTGWLGIQQAQADADDEKNRICCVVCRDVCETNNIHPPHKDKLVKRLADRICEIG